MSTLTPLGWKHRLYGSQDGRRYGGRVEMHLAPAGSKILLPFPGLIMLP